MELVMNIIQVKPDTNLWADLIDYAQNCSWEGAGAHLAELMRKNSFTD